MIINTSTVSSSAARTYKKRETITTRYENTITKAGETSDSDFISAYLNQASAPAASASESVPDSSASGDSVSADSGSAASGKKSSSEAADSTSAETSLYDLYKANLNTYRTDTLHESQLDTIKQVQNELFSYLMKLLFGEDWETAYNDFTGCSGDSLSAESQTYTYGYSTSTYTTSYEYSESESLNYSTIGSVTTADGRTIDFNVSLTLSRSFVNATSSQVDYTQPILIDPIVLNLDVPSASISDQSFYFDLDTDGEEEEISTLGNGSAFLALDANENGTIDDGSELFGTHSGNGFADLAEYDEDGNGWIDEADSVFSKLKVWYKNSDGSDSLLSLKDAGVGALCLDSAEGDFSLTDETNQTNAVLRRHGIFLYESGEIGTMQQMDLAT